MLPLTIKGGQMDVTTSNEALLAANQQNILGETLLTQYKKCSQINKHKLSKAKNLNELVQIDIASIDKHLIANDSYYDFKFDPVSFRQKVPCMGERDFLVSQAMLSSSSQSHKRQNRRNHNRNYTQTGSNFRNKMGKQYATAVRENQQVNGDMLGQSLSNDSTNRSNNHRADNSAQQNSRLISQTDDKGQSPMSPENLMTPVNKMLDHQSNEGGASHMSEKVLFPVANKQHQEDLERLDPVRTLQSIFNGKQYPRRSVASNFIMNKYKQKDMKNRAKAAQTAPHTNRNRKAQHTQSEKHQQFKSPEIVDASEDPAQILASTKVSNAFDSQLNSFFTPRDQALNPASFSQDNPNLDQVKLPLTTRSQAPQNNFTASLFEGVRQQQIQQQQRENHQPEMSPISGTAAAMEPESQNQLSIREKLENLRQLFESEIDQSDQRGQMYDKTTNHRQNNQRLTAGDWGSEGPKIMQQQAMDRRLALQNLRRQKVETTNDQEDLRVFLAEKQKQMEQVKLQRAVKKLDKDKYASNDDDNDLKMYGGKHHSSGSRIKFKASTLTNIQGIDAVVNLDEFELKQQAKMNKAGIDYEYRKFVIDQEKKQRQKQRELAKQKVIKKARRDPEDENQGGKVQYVDPQDHLQASFQNKPPTSSNDNTATLTQQNSIVQPDKALDLSKTQNETFFKDNKSQGTNYTQKTSSQAQAKKNYIKQQLQKIEKLDKEISQKWKEKKVDLIRQQQEDEIKQIIKETQKHIKENENESDNQSRHTQKEKAKDKSVNYVLMNKASAGKQKSVDNLQPKKKKRSDSSQSKQSNIASSAEYLKSDASVNQMQAAAAQGNLSPEIYFSDSEVLVNNKSKQAKRQSDANSEGAPETEDMVDVEGQAEFAKISYEGKLIKDLINSRGMGYLDNQVPGMQLAYFSPKRFNRFPRFAVFFKNKHQSMMNQHQQHDQLDEHIVNLNSSFLKFMMEQNLQRKQQNPENQQETIKITTQQPFISHFSDSFRDQHTLEGSQLTPQVILPENQMNQTARTNNTNNNNNAQTQIIIDETQLVNTRNNQAAVDHSIQHTKNSNHIQNQVNADTGVLSWNLQKQATSFDPFEKVILVKNIDNQILTSFRTLKGENNVVSDTYKIVHQKHSQNKVQGRFYQTMMKRYIDRMPYNLENEEDSTLQAEALLHTRLMGGCEYSSVRDETINEGEQILNDSVQSQDHHHHDQNQSQSPDQLKVKPLDLQQYKDKSAGKSYNKEGLSPTSDYYSPQQPKSYQSKDSQASMGKAKEYGSRGSPFQEDSSNNHQIQPIERPLLAQQHNIKQVQNGGKISQQVSVVQRIPQSQINTKETQQINNQILVDNQSKPIPIADEIAQQTSREENEISEAVTGGNNENINSALDDTILERSSPVLKKQIVSSFNFDSSIYKMSPQARAVSGNQRIETNKSKNDSIELPMFEHRNEIQVLVLNKVNPINSAFPEAPNVPQTANSNVTHNHPPSASSPSNPASKLNQDLRANSPPTQTSQNQLTHRQSSKYKSIAVNVLRGSQLRNKYPFKSQQRANMPPAGLKSEREKNLQLLRQKQGQMTETNNRAYMTHKQQKQAIAQAKMCKTAGGGSSTTNIPQANEKEGSKILSSAAIDQGINLLQNCQIQASRKSLTRDDTQKLDNSNIIATAYENIKNQNEQHMAKKQVMVENQAQNNGGEVVMHVNIRGSQTCRTSTSNNPSQNIAVIGNMSLENIKEETTKLAGYTSVGSFVQDDNSGVITAVLNKQDISNKSTDQQQQQVNIQNLNNPATNQTKNFNETFDIARKMEAPFQTCAHVRTLIDEIYTKERKYVNNVDNQNIINIRSPIFELNKCHQLATQTGVEKNKKPKQQLNRVGSKLKNQRTEQPAEQKLGFQASRISAMPKEFRQHFN